jgi:hypothetical protein
VHKKLIEVFDPFGWGDREEDVLDIYRRSPDQPVSELELPLALTVTQGDANLCHFSAAVVSHLWAGGPLPVDATCCKLYPASNILTSYPHTAFLIPAYQALLPYDRSGNESERIARLTIAYEALRFGYNERSFPILDLYWMPETSDQVLIGLSVFTDQNQEVYSTQSTSSVEEYLCSRNNGDAYSPTLLWCTGDGMGVNYADQDPHVYSVLKATEEGIIVRDARAYGVREGVSMGYREGNFAEDSSDDEKKTGIFFLSSSWLEDRLTAEPISDTGFRWFMGGNIGVSD